MVFTPQLRLVHDLRIQKLFNLNRNNEGAFFMKIIATTLVLAAMALANQASFAEGNNVTVQKEKVKLGLEAHFAKADVNKDGQLSRDEAQKGMPLIYQKFDLIDADKNGSITLVEIKDAGLVERFTKADVNKDGQVTRDEAKGVMPGVYDHFDKIDADKNGFVTLNEIRQTRLVSQTHHQRRAAH
jgi:Ca2+-binding EF-hand superfamily protein